MRHYHISVKSNKCIDIYLNDEEGKVQIIDALDKKNMITISSDDWNILIDRVKKGGIGKVMPKD